MSTNVHNADAAHLVYVPHNTLPTTRSCCATVPPTASRYARSPGRGLHCRSLLCFIALEPQLNQWSSIMKEVIGSFAVTDGAMRQQTVIINQEIILDTDGNIVDTKKSMTLNSIKGEPVYPGEKDNILTLTDGTPLRKTSHIRIGDPTRHAPPKKRGLPRR